MLLWALRGISFAQSLPSSYALVLRRAAASRGHAERPAICFGSCRVMETATLDRVAAVACKFVGVVHGCGPPKAVELVPDFAELKVAVGTLHIGFPPLLQLGVKLEEGADGRVSGVR